MIPPLPGNFHTHTRLCKHAVGDPVDYARAAVQAGLLQLGFSDHAPLPVRRWDHVRMSPAELPVYIAAVSEARMECPSLHILTGLECEFLPEYKAYYRDELHGRHALDYLVFAPHWFPHEGEWVDAFREPLTPAHLRSFARHTIEALSTNLFAFMAHPDLFGYCGLTWSDDADACARDICAAAADLDIPLEINALGFRREPIQTPKGPRRAYPWEPFWQVAVAARAPAIINSDAHRPQDIIANMDDALAFAKNLGIQPITSLQGRTVDG